jgi:cytochrome c2
MAIVTKQQFGAAALVLAAMAVCGNAMSSTQAKAILKAKACGSCHIIPGVEGAYSKYGPSLKGLGGRSRIVANTMENNAENMKDWLRNPKAVRPDTLMPNMGLSDEEIEILIEYFKTI